MDALTTSNILILSGLALGLVMGATARAARFCTFGAIEDFVLVGKTLRIKSWALAIAVAMISVQLLHQFGLARIDEVFYLGPRFGIAGAIAGGLLFGLGMSMVGTCGYGVLVRMAGGDLKAFFSFLILGLSGYMTARGITSLVRIYTVDALAIDLSAWGGQGIPHLIARLTYLPVENLWLPVGILVAGSILFYCFKDKDFRNSRRDIIAGILIGLSVAAAFFVTGTVGADPFDPVRVQSLTYVLPLGDTIMWLATFSGASITFSISVVLGTLAGAAIVAVIRRECKWEGFDDMREMRRQMLGSVAMGAGGITALGCTVGQGISGISTLSMSPPIALASIFLGASFGLRYLLTGSLGEAWHMLLSPREH